VFFNGVRRILEIQSLFTHNLKHDLRMQVQEVF